MHFVRGQLPSEEQLLMGLEPRSAKHRNPGDHWLDGTDRCSMKDFGSRDAGLFKFCERFDSIELWADPLANDQLVLVWLLDLLRPYREITSKLTLIQTDVVTSHYEPQSVKKWKLPVCKVNENHL